MQPLKVIEYSLRVTGIFGRNRKIKSQSFDLCDSAVKLSQDEIRELAVVVY